MSKSILRSFTIAITAVTVILSYGSAQQLQQKATATRADHRTLKPDSVLEKSLHWKPLGEPGSDGAITGFSFDPRNGKRMLMSGDMLGVGLSEDGGKTWLPTFGLKSYECGDFTWHPTDPKTVWLGTMSGPYISKDGGKTWQERRGGFPEYSEASYSAPVEKVLYDPADSHHLLAFGGSSRRWESPGKPLWGVVWESKDSGDSWHRLADLGRNIVSAAWAAGSKSDLLIALDGSGIQRSRDGGKTWAKSSEGLPHGNVERVIAHPTNPTIAWASLGNFKPASGDCLPGGIYKTTDGGKSWHDISAGLSQAHNPDSNFTARYKAFAVCMANPDVMYAADDAWNTGVVYGTKDGGKAWRAQATKYNVGNDNNDPARQKISQVKTAYFAGIAGTVMAVDPKNSSAAYCLGTEHMLATTDGGATWFDGGNNSISDNHWRGRGFSGLCCTGIFFNPARRGDALLTAMDAGKLWRSTDDLHSWEYHGLEPWPWGGGVCAVYAGNRIYSTAGQFGQFLGILRSTDDGKTFKPIGGSEHGLPALQAQNAQPSAIYAHSDAPLKVDVIIAGKLYQSVDGGEQWKIVQAGLNLNWLVGDTKNPERVYLSGEHGVYLTTDDGVTVKNIGGPKPASRLSIDSKGRLYAASWRTDHGGVWRWDNERWTRLWNNSFVHQIASDPTDPTRIAVATHDNPYHDVTHATGVWVSADDGKTWRQANDGLPVLRGESITFDPHHEGRMVFGSNGRGFFVTTWNKDFLPDTTAVSYTTTADDMQHAVVDTTVAAVPVAAPIVLRNGDMEAGNDIPANWDSKWVGRGTLTVARDTVVKHGGKASLRVASQGGSAQGQASQMIDGTGGAKFTISGALKTAGTANVHVAIQAFTDDYKPISFQSVQFAANDTDWQVFQKEMTLPDKTGHFGVLLFLDGEGKAWLDDVKLSGTKVQNVAADPALVPPPVTQDPALPFQGFFADYPKAWMNFHNGFVTRAKEGNADIVFLGDSITQGWDKTIWEQNFAPMQAVNFGIGGDKTSQILWRIEQGTLNGLKPKLVVLAIGVNNLWRNEHGNGRIAEGIGVCVKAIRAKCPQSKVLVIGIFPTQQAADNPLRAAIREINLQAARLADGKTVRFVDFGAKFLSPGGTLSKEIMPDYLHPNAKGYRIYVGELLPIVKEMLARP